MTAAPAADSKIIVTAVLSVHCFPVFFLMRSGLAAMLWSTDIKFQAEYQVQHDITPGYVPDSSFDEPHITSFQFTQRDYLNTLSQNYTERISWIANISKQFLSALNENSNYVLTSGRKVTLFRTLTVAPSVGLFSKLATKPTKPIIVLSP
jgi:hypothetical protein